MIGNLKPYPAYKDSGVPWLGKVPEHWKIIPNRAILREVKERDCPEEPLLSVTISEGIIPQLDLLADTSKKDSSNVDKSAYKLVRLGDIAYNKMRAWQGAIGASAYQGIISPAYVVQRPCEGVIPYYLHYLMRIPAFSKEAERWSYGITSDMWSLRPEHFKLIYSCCPPFEEQILIVRFLNCFERYIYDFSHAKQKLVELLEKARNAIVQHAVTHGLDPNVRLKPSGIDWLGRVPIHWDIRRLGQIGGFFKSTGGSKEDEVSSGIPCIRYGDLYTTHDYHVSKNRSFIRTEISRDYTLIKFGDILFATSGETIDEIGKSAVNLMQGEVRCGGDVILFRPKCQVDARFMGYSTDSRPARIQKATMGRGITIMHVYAHQLKRLAIAIPPLAEQTAIASFLDQRTSEIDGAVKATQRQIDLLREYRTRLISDVVTGKLDVREAAAQLPKQLSETVSVDAAHGLPHMSTGSNRDSDASTEEDEP